MIDARPLQTEPVIQVTEGLFAWRGGQVVLIGERSDERWILARGWPEEDRLTDVRRWSFATPERFAVQVLRLVRDVAGRGPEADRARDAALAWATGNSQYWSSSA